MTRPFRYWLLQRIVNPLLERGIRAGRTPPIMAVLETRGRRTGAGRRTPVAVFNEDGDRWLVSVYGQTGWVRNLRATPEANLLRGGRLERITVVEERPADHPAVVKQMWTAAPPVSRFFAGPFVGARDDDSDDAWRREAPRHPIFRILRD